jgi:hypothetical protein
MKAALQDIALLVNALYFINKPVFTCNSYPFQSNIENPAIHFR